MSLQATHFCPVSLWLVLAIDDVQANLEPWCYLAQICPIRLDSGLCLAKFVALHCLHSWDKFRMQTMRNWSEPVVSYLQLWENILLSMHIVQLECSGWREYDHSDLSLQVLTHVLLSAALVLVTQSCFQNTVSQMCCIFVEVFVDAANDEFFVVLLTPSMLRLPLSP